MFNVSVCDRNMCENYRFVNKKMHFNKCAMPLMVFDSCHLVFKCPYKIPNGHELGVNKF